MVQLRSSGRPWAALLFAFLATGAVAQTLTISPGTVVSEGTTVGFDYADPSQAGATIVVTVTGGTPPTTDSITITLDASGNGSGKWKAANGWRKAFVMAPGCPQQIITILPGPAL
jgi:hypothetical protein